MPNSPRHIGVLLAAGRGSRMGGGKQLKLWPTADGPKPLTCAAYDSICHVCDEMVIVLGHEADAVRAVLAGRSYHAAESSADRPMFESIRAGLRAAIELDPQSTIILQPGDHPEIQFSTLEILIQSSLQRPGYAIIPEHAGRGGHPVLIPSPVVAALIAAECPEGLGQFWLEHPELCVRVPVDDPSIHRDVDSPADLLP
jgi:molybdenum cofactor cytidylyltransferase